MGDESLIEEPLAPKTKMTPWVGCMTAFLFVILGAILMGNVLVVAKMIFPVAKHPAGQPEVISNFVH